MSVPVCIGVGGSFEMASGLVRRAPVWMQNAGLEWAYRFLQEPTRLWERYFVRDLPFFAILVWRVLAERRAEKRNASRMELRAEAVLAPPVLTGTKS